MLVALLRVTAAKPVQVLKALSLREESAVEVVSWVNPLHELKQFTPI